MMLKEVWEEEVAEAEEGLELYISPEVSKVLEGRMILVEDMQKVIGHAEKTGDKIKRRQNRPFHRTS